MAGVFGTSAIDLSMCNNEGQHFTANVYMLEGVQNADGSLREMSIGQLVMAICLSRATELEQKIVGKMESIAGTSAQLEKLTALDKNMVEWMGDGTNKLYNRNWSNPQYAEALAIMGWGESATFAYADIADTIAKVESKMDSLNSLSQTTLIDIQALTSKRDDTYTLVSNVLKSLNQVLIGNVNNF